MSKADDIKLTAKQDLFCRHYVSNKHKGTKAAIDAGYSENTAGQMACENLKKPQILERIKELEKPVIEKLEIDENWVISKLKGFADSKITDYFKIENGEIVLKDFSDLTDAQISAIESIKQTKNGIEIKLVDKKGSTVDIGKHFGMFKEQLEGNINHNHTHKVFVVPAFGGSVDVSDLINNAGN